MPPKMLEVTTCEDDCDELLLYEKLDILLVLSLALVDVPNKQEFKSSRFSTGALYRFKDLYIASRGGEIGGVETFSESLTFQNFLGEHAPRPP
jgi:hypothetical protein